MVNLNDFNLLAGQFGKSIAGASAAGIAAPLARGGARSIFSTDSIALAARADEDPVDLLFDRYPDPLLA